MLGFTARSAVAAGALAVAVVTAPVRVGADERGSRVAEATLPGGITSVMPLTEPRGGALWAGADPWVVLHGGSYYWCQSSRDRIEIFRSDRLDERGQGRVVWAAPRVGWNRAQVWAPELHFVRGRWYIYYAASGGQNETHRMGVLECEGADPFGRWIDRGMLYTGDDPGLARECAWAIDGTIIERGKELYFVWSGWEGGRDVQYLYAAPMSDPATISGTRVKLCANDTYDWERVGERRSERGLNEGPTILRRNGRIFLVYSCSGSWQASYKLGMLWADEGANLLDPKNWKKVERPVFESTPEVFGVGHCSFTTSADGRGDFLVYHSKVSRQEGWRRVVRVQRFGWTKDGFPDFGKPASMSNGKSQMSKVGVGPAER